jgi:WD40 repeat protein
MYELRIYLRSRLLVLLGAPQETNLQQDLRTRQHAFGPTLKDNKNMGYETVASIPTTQTKDPSLELVGHTGAVSVVTWNPTNPEQLATTSLDSTLRLWDARSGQCTSRIAAPGEGINLAWSPCGNVIACGNKVRIAVFLVQTSSDKSAFTHRCSQDAFGEDHKVSLFYKRDDLEQRRNLFLSYHRGRRY